MEKNDSYAALEAITEIEVLFSRAHELWDSIPVDIQRVINAYHNKNATIGHCLRWGLQGAGEIKENWESHVTG